MHWYYLDISEILSLYYFHLCPVSTLVFDSYSIHLSSKFLFSTQFMSLLSEADVMLGLEEVRKKLARLYKVPLLSSYNSLVRMLVVVVVLVVVDRVGTGVALSVLNTMLDALGVVVSFNTSVSVISSS